MNLITAHPVSRPRYLHKGYMTLLKDIPESERPTIQPQNTEWFKKPIRHKDTLPKTPTPPAMTAFEQRYEAMRKFSR